MQHDLENLSVQGLLMLGHVVYTQSGYITAMRDTEDGPQVFVRDHNGVSEWMPLSEQKVQTVVRGLHTYEVRK